MESTTSTSSGVTLPTETWVQIVQEVENIPYEVRWPVDGPFNGWSCQPPPPEKHYKLGFADLKNLRLVCRILSSITAARLFEKIRINAYIAPLNSGIESFQAFSSSVHAQHVKEIYLDDAWELNPNRNKAWDQPAVDVEPQHNHAHKLLQELAKVLPFAGPKLLKVHTLRLDGAYLERDSIDLKLKEKLADAVLDQLLRSLPDANLRFLQAALMLVDDMSPSQWIAPKISSVQTLHIDSGWVKKAYTANVKKDLLFSKMPNLRVILMTNFDGANLEFFDYLKGLTEIHIDSGEMTIKRLTTLLQRSASTLEKVSVRSTYFSFNDRGLQRAFRGVNFPKLSSVELMPTAHSPNYMSDRIPMASFSWSRQTHGEEKLNTWLPSSAWHGWDDQWSDS